MGSSIDDTIPALGAPASKVAFRANFMAAKSELDHGGFVTDPTTAAEATASQALANLHALIPVPQSVALLSLTVSDPPTQVEGQETTDKVDEMILALRAAGVFLA